MEPILNTGFNYHFILIYGSLSSLLIAMCHQVSSKIGYLLGVKSYYYHINLCITQGSFKAHFENLRQVFHAIYVNFLCHMQIMMQS